MRARTLCFLGLGLIVGMMATDAEAAKYRRDESLYCQGGVAIRTPEEHYQLGARAYGARQWRGAAVQFRLVSQHFPDTSYGQDALFFLGAAEYNMHEFDIANDVFDQYLQCQSNPQYFQAAFEYKFFIAEHFRHGAPVRLLGAKAMPKWVSGRGLALTIYDQVVTSLPTDEIAAKALFGKADVLWQDKDYRGSVEAFQMVTKRYPTHELAPESYLLINKVYIDQSQHEFQNPDILAFAAINVSKFEEQFPGEARLVEAQAHLMKINEIYAKGLFETGCFYERIRQPRAAVLYYQKAMVEFPETSTARICRRKLCRLDPRALEVELPSQEEYEEEEIDFLGKLGG